MQSGIVPGGSYATIIDPITKNPLRIESDGSLNANIQDQTTRAFDNRMCQSVSGPYVLSSNFTPNSYTINLIDATGLTVGDEVGLFQDTTSPASYFGKILNISSNILTMDTPCDQLFNTELSPVLFKINCNAAINGSVTPQIFSITNNSSIEIDITRVIIHITDDSSMDDGKFGGMAALTRGVVLRKYSSDDSDYYNYWNRALKTNGEFGLVAYDKTYDEKAPAGIYGMTVRYTFAGQDKHGVAVRVGTGDQLQLVVQDDLTGLSSFEIMAQGHFVQNF